MKQKIAIILRSNGLLAGIAYKLLLLLLLQIIKGYAFVIVLQSLTGMFTSNIHQKLK